MLGDALQFGECFSGLGYRANFLANVKRCRAADKCRTDRDVVHAEDCAQRESRDSPELNDVSDCRSLAAGRCCSRGHDASWISMIADESANGSEFRVQS